jgi:hypothetical protein
MSFIFSVENALAGFLIGIHNALSILEDNIDYVKTNIGKNIVANHIFEFEGWKNF